MGGGLVLSEPFAFNGFNHNGYGITEAVPIAGEFFDYLFHTYHDADSKSWNRKTQYFEQQKERGSYYERSCVNLEDQDIKNIKLKEITGLERYYDVIADGFDGRKANQLIIESNETGSKWGYLVHDAYENIYNYGKSAYQIQRQEFIMQRDLMKFLRPVFGSHLNLHEALGGLDQGWRPDFDVDIHPVTEAPDEKHAREGKIGAYKDRMYPIEAYAQPIKTILVEVLGYDAIERPDKTITTSCSNPNERFYDYILMGWKIEQLPRYVWDEDSDKYVKEPPPNAAVVYKELELGEELKNLKNSLSLEDREKFFKNPKSRANDMARMAIDFIDGKYHWYTKTPGALR